MGRWYEVKLVLCRKLLLSLFHTRNGRYPVPVNKITNLLQKDVLKQTTTEL